MYFTTPPVRLQVSITNWRSQNIETQHSCSTNTTQSNNHNKQSARDWKYNTATMVSPIAMF
jgi:hypothetical protein